MLFLRNSFIKLQESFHESGLSSKSAALRLLSRTIFEFIKVKGLKYGE